MTLDPTIPLDQISGPQLAKELKEIGAILTRTADTIEVRAGAVPGDHEPLALIMAQLLKHAYLRYGAAIYEAARRLNG